LNPDPLHQYVVMYRVERLKNLHSTYLVLLRVLFGYQNKRYFHLKHYVSVITKMEYIYCALRSETINTIRVNLSLEMVNFSESVSGKTCHSLPY
jgi:hypothetical protein